MADGKWNGYFPRTGRSFEFKILLLLLWISFFFFFSLLSYFSFLIFLFIKNFYFYISLISWLWSGLAERIQQSVLPFGISKSTQKTPAVALTFNARLQIIKSILHLYLNNTWNMRCVSLIFNGWLFVVILFLTHFDL